MANLFQGLLFSILRFFGSTLGVIAKRAPLLSAFFAVSVVAIGTYLTAMHTLVASIQVTVPQIVIDVWGWFMPSNVPILISALFAARLARWSHLRFLAALKFKANSVTR